MRSPYLDFELDETTRELSHRGQRVRLGEKPFRLLQALLGAEGGVVTRETLRQLLWSDDTNVDFDNNLNTAVATLRQLLGDSARSPQYIETIPKVGYRILGTGSAAVRATTNRRRRLVMAAVAAFAVTALTMAVLWVGRTAPAAPRMSVHQRAQSLYERGMYLRGQFQVAVPEPSLLTRARDAFREARRHDPTFAPAAAGEADTLVEMSFMGLAGFRHGLEQARAAARQALALDRDNQAALRVMGSTALFLDWDFVRARVWLDRAAADNSADARTLLAQATYFAAAGWHQAAIHAAEQAVALDPAAYYVRADLALFYLAGGRNQDAAESTRRVLDVAPGFGPALACAVQAYERLGQWEEAGRAARLLMTATGASDADLTGLKDAEPREVVEAWHRWDLARVETMAAGRVDDFALQLALRYAAAGDRAAALDHLERAFAQRSALLVFLPSFPELDPLHGDPRFERLARRIRRG